MSRLVMVALSFSSLLIPSMTWSQGTGIVEGVVTDSQDAVFPLKSIIIASSRVSQQSKLDEKGEFHFDLAPGVYTITIDIPYMFPYRRAPFRVMAGQRIYLHLVPRLRIYAISSDALKGDVAHKALPVEYESLKISAASEQSALVEYARKSVLKDGVTEYENAVFTYQDWTIVADRICIDSSRKRINAVGDVRAERGQTRLAMHAQEKEFRYVDFSSVVSGNLLRRNAPLGHSSVRLEKRETPHDDQRRSAGVHLFRLAAH